MHEQKRPRVGAALSVLELCKIGDGITTCFVSYSTNARSLSASVVRKRYAVKAVNDKQSHTNPKWDWVLIAFGPEVVHHSKCNHYHQANNTYYASVFVPFAKYLFHDFNFSFPNPQAYTPIGLDKTETFPSVSHVQICL